MRSTDVSAVNLQNELRKDSFASWFIVEVIAREKVPVPDPANVSVRLIINGQEFDALPTMERLGREFDYFVAKKSNEQARAIVDDTLDKLRAALREKMDIEIDEED